jgi:membrane-associated HD superfamily phosphohydrolase
MIHEHNKLHPWNALGIDLLLGVRADMPTTQREQHFLPENLERDFAQATILNADGTTRKLVKERRIVIEPGIQLVKEEFPISPLVCAIILLVVSLIIFVWEWRHQHTTVWWDTLLMLTIGLAGCIVLLMFFSEHPATSSNLMVLLLNPLHLFFIPSVIRRRKTYYWRGLPYVVLLFFIGGLWQDYPGEMYFVALFLLIRYCSHLRNDK